MTTEVKERTGIGRVAPPLSITFISAAPATPVEPKRQPPEPPPEEEEDDDEDTPEEQDSRRIVTAAADALQGRSSKPDEALNEFIEVFGREELDALRRMVREEEEEPVAAAHGRLVEGPGKGLEDRVPARAGDQKVLLSDGEYVVPADVVSMLGDGSTKAGSRALQAMCARVRQQKTGTKKQAKALDKKALPA